MTARSFTATGEVNQLATKKDKTVTRLVDGAFEEQDPEIWDPKSAWALTDALEGIKWAMIFVDIGPEPAIETWIQYITKLVRTRPKYLAVVKAFFDHSSWRIAIQMRNGTTFEAITKDILTDIVYQNEHLHTRMTAATAEKEEGKGQGKHKQTQNFGTPERKRAKTTPWSPRATQSPRQQTPQRQQQAEVPTCETCGKSGHASAQCWYKEQTQQTGKGEWRTQSAPQQNKGGKPKGGKGGKSKGTGKGKGGKPWQGKPGR